MGKSYHQKLLPLHFSVIIIVFSTIALTVNNIVLRISPWPPWWLSDKESTSSAGDAGDMDLILGLGRFREGHGNPLQYSCLENPVDRGAWWTAVHSVAKSWMRLKPMSMHTCQQEFLSSQVSLTSLSSSVSSGNENPRVLPFSMAGIKM